MSRRITRELTELPDGSVISSPFPDIEGSIAVKASDGLWLIVGEIPAITDRDLAEWMDDDYTVIRRGYGDE